MDIWQYLVFDISYNMFQIDIQLSKFHNAQSCEPKLARHLGFFINLPVAEWTVRNNFYVYKDSHQPPLHKV